MNQVAILNAAAMIESQLYTLEGTIEQELLESTNPEAAGFLSGALRILDRAVDSIAVPSVETLAYVFKDLALARKMLATSRSID